MDTQGKKLIEKIQKENIKVRPKFVFKAKNIFFWVLFLICLLLVAIISVFIIYRISHAVEYMPRYMKEKDSAFFLMKAVSIIWILIIIVSAVISYFSIRHTKHGYKYPSIALGFIIFLILIFLTMGFIFGKRDKDIAYLAEKARFARSLEYLNEEYWSNPEKGRLEGKILSMEKAKYNTIMLKEVEYEENNKIWKIFFDDNTKIHPFVTLDKDTKIKVIGIKKEGESFYAYLIIPHKRIPPQYIQKLCSQKETPQEIQACMDYAKKELKKDPMHMKEYKRMHSFDSDTEEYFDDDEYDDDEYDDDKYKNKRKRRPPPTKKGMPPPHTSKP